VSTNRREPTDSLKEGHPCLGTQGKLPRGGEYTFHSLKANIGRGLEANIFIALVKYGDAGYICCLAILTLAVKLSSSWFPALAVILVPCPAEKMAQRRATMHRAYLWQIQHLILTTGRLSCLLAPQAPTA